MYPFNCLMTSLKMVRIRKLIHDEDLRTRFWDHEGYIWILTKVFFGMIKHLVTIQESNSKSIIPSTGIIFLGFTS